MFSLQVPGLIFSVLSLTLCGSTSATPLYPKLIITAGGGLPNTTLPATVSQSWLKEIQLAKFLESLEVSFFTAGSANITKWGNGYSNDLIEIHNRIPAFSTSSPSFPIPSVNVLYSKKRSIFKVSSLFSAPTTYHRFHLATTPSQLLQLKDSSSLQTL